MRVTFRNRNMCLVCNRSIIYSELYQCKHCKHYYHNNCLNDIIFINNNKKCIFCQRYINRSNIVFTNCVKDIVRGCCCDLMPLCCVIGSMIGILVYFAI